MCTNLLSLFPCYQQESWSIFLSTKIVADGFQTNDQSRTQNNYKEASTFFDHPTGKFSATKRTIFES